MNPCEWNPQRDVPAEADDPPHGPATWSIGSGHRNLHVCDACAARPALRRLRSRTRLRVGSASREITTTTAMTCPLCGSQVPANSHHRCQIGEPT